MNYYVIKAKPIKKVYWNGLFDTLDETLGEFIVTPIYKGKKIVEFKEILTNRVIAKRLHFIDQWELLDFIDYFDNYNDIERKAGDVAIVLEQLENEDQLNEYLKQSKEEVESKIDSLEINAIKSYQNEFGLEFENQPLDYYKKELYELKIKDGPTLFVYPEKRFGSVKSYREIHTGKKVLRYKSGDCDSYGISSGFYLGTKFMDLLDKEYFEFDETLPATRSCKPNDINQYINSMNPMTVERIEEAIERCRQNEKSKYQKRKKIG